MIIVTNDDGVYSLGLRTLYNSVKDLMECIVIAPETPKSTSGLGITLHKPLRVRKLELWNFPIYSINGTPSDVVHFALNQLVKDPKLLVSGVNIGDNTSVQVILSSGTVGAAAQAALLGIPSIAFSAAVSDEDKFQDLEYSKMLEVLCKEISRQVLEYGMPRGVDVLNVNFPEGITRKTRVRVVRPARMRYTEYVEKREDPRGNPYYWVYGEPITPEPGTDVYTVLVDRDIAITPLSFNLSPDPIEVGDEIYVLARRVESKILRASEKQP